MYVYLSVSRCASCKCTLTYDLHVLGLVFVYLCMYSTDYKAMNCLVVAPIIYDNQLTERQTLTLDFFHTEKAALGLTARANRVLTGC